MQRVSAFLPSWEKKTSNMGTKQDSHSHSQSVQASNTASGKTATGFFGWSNRSSTSSTRASVLGGLNKINVSTANKRTSGTGSIVNGRVQREAFWPANLELECDKAARIIKSFCADGYLASLNDGQPTTSDEPKTPVKVSKKIPKRIIQNAAGIAVFTCMRNGLWMTGSGGSGILIARKSDGTWSPPSGIMLHTPTLSFIIGVDVYDCVLVINSLHALEAITQSRVTLGEDVKLTSGPLVPLDSPGTEFDINLKELGDTVLTYMKARGQEQVVNMTGCILTERANENERFYESSVSQLEILSGNVTRHVEETAPLAEVIKMAEGRIDFDPTLISKIAVEPAPGDANIASPGSTPISPRQDRDRAFGIPQTDDPDPFGILALEMAGMEIREAGSRLRPASSQIDFHARPPSSALSKKYRQSGETFLTKSNRESYMSSRTVKSQVTDAGTQTSKIATPETSPSPSQSENGSEQTTFEKIPERNNDEEEDGDQEIDYTTVDLSPLKHLSQPPTSPALQKSSMADAATTTEQVQDATRLRLPRVDAEVDRRSKASSMYEDDTVEVSDNEEDADDEDEDFDCDEEPVVFEVAAVQQRPQAVASRMVHAKGNVVTIPKRIPPPLPTRNPARASMTNRSDMSGDALSFRSSMSNKLSDSESPETEAQKHTSSTLQADNIFIGHSRPSSAASGDVKLDVPQTQQSEPDTPRATEPEAASDKSKTGEISSHTTDDDITDVSTPLAAVKAEGCLPEAGKGEDIKPEESKAAASERDGQEADIYDDAQETKSKNSEVDSSATEAKDHLLDDVLSGENNSPEPETESTKAEDVGQVTIEKADDDGPQKESSFEDKEPEAVVIKETVLDVTPPEQASGLHESSSKSPISIDTGATDARSSFDNSSYTTPPTSERHFSGDEDETPKQASKEAELAVTSDGHQTHVQGTDAFTTGTAISAST